MDNEVIVKVSNLGKCFHIYDKPRDRIKQIVQIVKKTYYKEFWALQGINFSIKKGEAFGIIGRNGSGKSTLLQLLCGILNPTCGEIKLYGRIAALLELGAGFNPEFTGKENVYINAAILGLSKREIDEIYDEIVAFADIGDFIHQPVKVYSSGMFVRLAFAVQAHIQPDILIVDEALSVGDIFFQQKCKERMQYLRENGTTLIFVSHDLGAIRELCDTALYLKKGKLIYWGKTSEAIRFYHRERGALPEAVKLSSEQSFAFDHPFSPPEITQFKESAYWINTTKNCPTQKGKIIAIAILDSNNVPISNIKMGHILKFQILCQSYIDEPFHVTITLKNRHDHIVSASGTYTENYNPIRFKKNQFGLVEIALECKLEASSYTFCIILNSHAEPHLDADIVDKTPWLGPLNIVWDYENERAPWLGMFGLPVEIKLIKLEDAAR